MQDVCGKYLVVFLAPVMKSKGQKSSLVTLLGNKTVMT